MKMFLGSQLTYFYKSKTSLHFYKSSSTWFWIRGVLSSNTHIWGCNWFFFSWYALCAITQGTTYCSECSQKTEMVCIYSNNSKWQHNSIWKQHEGSSCSLFNQRLEHMQRKLQNLPWTKYGSKYVLWTIYKQVSCSIRDGTIPGNITELGKHIESFDICWLGRKLEKSFASYTGHDTNFLSNRKCKLLTILLSLSWNDATTSRRTSQYIERIHGR